MVILEDIDENKRLSKEEKEDLINQLEKKIQNYPLNEDDALSREKLAELHISLAYVYSDYEESYDEAMAHFFNALRLLKHGTKLQKATLKGSIGSMCYAKKDFTNAARYYRESLSLLEDLHEREIMIGKKGLGMSLFGLGVFEQGIEKLLEAAEICVDVSDINNYMDIILILKKYYASKNDWEIVIEFEKKALKILQQMDNDYEISMSFLELGLLYSKLSDYQSALTMFKKSVNAAIKHGSNKVIYQGLIMVAETLFNLREIDESKAEYLKALSLAEFMGNEEEVKKLKIILTNLNCSQKRIKNAIEKGKMEKRRPKKYKK